MTTQNLLYQSGKLTGPVNQVSARNAGKNR